MTTTTTTFTAGRASNKGTPTKRRRLHPFYTTSNMVAARVLFLLLVIVASAISLANAFVIIRPSSSSSRQQIQIMQGTKNLLIMDRHYHYKRVPSIIKLYESKWYSDDDNDHVLKRRKQRSKSHRFRRFLTKTSVLGGCLWVSRKYMGTVSPFVHALVSSVSAAILLRVLDSLTEKKGIRQEEENKATVLQLEEQQKGGTALESRKNGSFIDPNDNEEKKTRLWVEDKLAKNREEAERLYKEREARRLEKGRKWAETTLESISRQEELAAERRAREAEQQRRTELWLRNAMNGSVNEPLNNNVNEPLNNNNNNNNDSSTME